MDNDYRLFIEFTKPARGFAPVSTLIRLIQRTPYSHVRVRWVTKGTHSEICYEAGGGSIHFIGLAALERKPVTVVRRYLLELNKEEYRLFLSYCLKYAGINYGTLQLVGMAISYLFRSRKNKLADGKKTMVCSELVYYLLHEALGYPIDFRPEVDGPRELDKQLQILDNQSTVVTRLK